MKPLVSILVPAYNAEPFIASTLRSALDQTWPNTEIIVVDDGSKDGTLSVARQFESSKLRVVSQANQGAAAARNHALSLSRGEFIQWLDADDLLASDKIARQMAVFEAGADRRTLLSSAWGSFYFRPARALFRENSLWCDLSPADWLVRKLGDNVFMQTGAWLVSRELTERAGQWDTRLLSDDDGEYFCRVILASREIRFIREARTMYRWSGPGSLNNIGSSRRKMHALLLSMRMHIDYLRSVEDSPRVRAACVRYLQTGLSRFFPESPDLMAEIEKLARDLGGQLEPVRFPWKYAWIESLFGSVAAKRVQGAYNHFKSKTLFEYDRVLSKLDPAPRKTSEN
jgi:glycosyltransferase involved in cell wall biosynthesis